MQKLLWTFVMTCVFAGMGAVASTEAQADSKIAFVSNRGGVNYEIYVMNADGSNETRLTDASLGQSQNPSWSPDGAQITFTINSKFYTMDADGSNLTNLTNNPGSRPSWSPDGTQIAFQSWGDIYVMDADGSNPINLTEDTWDSSDNQPAWSPDGTQIAFNSNRDGNTEIYVMDADGSNQTRLTNNAGSNSAPAWSPDGMQIAYDDIFDVYVMDADGSNQVNVTSDGTSVPRNGQPTWSPDGSKIAFFSYRDGNLSIYTMDADGANPVRLTNAPHQDYQPAWSPELPEPVPSISTHGQIALVLLMAGFATAAIFMRRRRTPRP